MVPSKELVIAAGIPIGEIKPFSTRSGIGANIVELLYKPLFRIGLNGEILPELGDQIIWQDKENTKLLIVLKSVSAQDVKLTINQAKKNLGGDLAEGLKNLKSVHVLSEYKVLFELVKFDRAFLILLSQIPIVAFSNRSNETGEFSLVLKTDQEVILHRREFSQDKINSIRILVIPSTRRAIRELVAGNVDLLFFARQNEYDVLTDISGVQVALLNTRLLYNLLENKKPSRTNDSIDWGLVRRSMDFSPISKDIGLNENGLVKMPVPLKDPWSFSDDNNSSGITDDQVGRDRKGTRYLSFLGEQGRDRIIARILKRSLESIGYSIQLVDLTPSEFEEYIFSKRDFDLVLLPFNVKDTLMSNYLVFHSPEGPESLNFSNYKNPEVDKNLEEARYSPDENIAKLGFRKAMISMMQDPPGLFLFWLKTPIVYRDACSGFVFSSNEFFSSLKDVRCEPSAAN